MDHVALLDKLVELCHGDAGRFVRHGSGIIDPSTDQGATDYLNAMRASTEYYLYDVLVPEPLLPMFREKNIIHPKRAEIPKEEMERIEQEYKRRWEEITF